MPYFTEGGGSKSPCQYQKKSIYNSNNNNNGSGQCHIIPITKRPIEKVTTRSQAQYQQMIKTMGTDAILDNGKDRNNNSNNHLINHPNSFLTSKSVATSGATVTNLNNGTATKKDSTLAKAMTIATKRNSNARQTTSSSTASSINNNMDCDVELIQASQFLPFSPHKVLGNPDFSTFLTSHEKKEIIDYPRIYFIGKKGIMKRTPETPFSYVDTNGLASKVYGFDDNNGSYIPILHDHVAYRYEVLKVIGKGTFGIVLQAYDHKTNRNVALKVIRNQARFHTQAKEEIKILTKLLENDPDDKFNVVHMYEHFMFRNHPCIVFELLSLNLFELSRKNSFNGFTLSLIKRFTFAIVKCLYALSKYDIIHCDLKPENILLKQPNRSGIKVIDFGSSCFSNKRVHTYIQSRYYRSPEVILGGKYGPQIDMWSLGCILAELYEGRPLLDGENESDQLACMMELLDVPPVTFLNKCKESKVRKFFDNAGNPVYCARYLQGQYHAGCGLSPRGKTRGKPGSRALLFTCKDGEFVDFIRQCLIWDPSGRMTPNSALKHPWLSKRTHSDLDHSSYEHMSP